MTRSAGSALAAWASPEPASAPGPVEFSPKMVTVTDPHGRQAAAIRALAGELSVRHLQAGHRGLAVCGVSRAVGVSFITANLAVALSERGHSVLLVDANLEHPCLHDLIRPEASPVGLRDALAGDGPGLHDVVRPDVLPNLALMYAGHPSDLNHQELLGSDALRRLMEAAMRDYDLTLLDTSAANRSADARRVATVVGHALVVARKDHTFAEDIATFMRELAQDGVSVVGSVFNAV